MVQPGGERDGIGQRVSGVAPPASGERVVLFLERAGPYHRVVGLAQGVYRVVPVDGQHRAPGGAGRAGGAGAGRAARTDARGSHPACPSPSSAPRSRRRDEGLGRGAPLRAPARPVRAVRANEDRRRHPIASAGRSSSGTRRTLSFVQSTAGDPALGPGAFDAVSRSAQTWEAQLQACGNLDLAEGAHSASRFVRLHPERPEREPGPLPHRAVLGRWCRPGDPCHTARARAATSTTAGTTEPPSSALTTSSYVIATASCVDADVELNAATATPTIVDSPPCSPGAISTSCVANDVQNAITHELGHFLGLDHSPDPSSTMYATEPLGEMSKRVLDSGSKQFVCDVYPAGQASRDCTSSGGGNGNGSGGCSSAGGAVAVGPGLLLLLALVTRRSRPAGRAGA